MTKTRRVSKQKTKGKNKSVIRESVLLTQPKQVREVIIRRNLKKKEKDKEEAKKSPPEEGWA